MGRPHALRVGQHTVRVEKFQECCAGEENCLFVWEENCLFVEGEVVHSSCGDLVGRGTAFYAWSSSEVLPQIADGLLDVETFAKKTRSGRELFITRVRDKSPVPRDG